MNKSRPPQLAQRILHTFLREELREEVTGDLEEQFLTTMKSKSPGRARLNYWFQVMNYIRPFAIRKARVTSLNNYAMYRSYFKIGFRGLLRNKGYAAINVVGLAVGMAVAITIGLWVDDELSFNQYHDHMSRVGQVLRNGTLNDVTLTTNYQPFPLAEALRDEYGSNFTYVVKAWPQGDHNITARDKTVKQSGVFMEPDGAEMFTLKMVQGTRSGLVDPHAIFLSAAAAKALFGEEDPLGQLVRVDNTMDAKVTGIYEDLPSNTHFAGADFVAAFALFESDNPWMKTQGFKNNFLDVYVEIQPSTTFEQVSASIRDLILRKVSDDAEFVAVRPALHVHPMQKWHLYAEWRNGINTGGLIQFVWLFGLVGVFVLILACINFMNLSTARAERRAKEVGIRKTIGSARNQLVSQFLTESLLVVVLAAAISLLLVAVSLPWFNDLAAKDIQIPFSNTYFWVAGIGFVVMTSLFAGSYPAFYLSSFKPVSVLKGVLRRGSLGSLPRKVMVVVQFTVSVTLIIGTFVVYQQIQYGKNRPVGYDRDGLLMIPLTSDHARNFNAYKTALRNTGMVEEVAASQSPLTAVWSSNGGFTWRDKDPDLQAEFATLAIDPNYGKVVGWEFIKGRDFSINLASDSLGLVINEEAARLLGLEHPIGESVHWEPVWRSPVTFTIIGVIKDMVMQSPFHQVMPTVFFIDSGVNWLNVRLRKDIPSAEALQAIEAVSKQLVPGIPFDYSFADQAYASKFAQEERIGQLSAVFTVLAVFISALGLFGLASFVAEQRTKEIGIRKVVGASVFSLWKLLCKDFVVLVLVASLMAIPVGWYLLSDWLDNYAYKMQISWWVFALSVGGATVITLITVSYQAVSAAMKNPVSSLRAE